MRPVWWIDASLRPSLHSALRHRTQARQAAERCEIVHAPRVKVRCKRLHDWPYHRPAAYIRPPIDVDVEDMVALRHLSAGLAAVVAACLLVGCTASTGTTATESPTASPTQSPVASPTRSETAEERKQREAFEAAEKAYRRGFQEVGRLAMEGGAESPTRELLSTMTGHYLNSQMDELRSFKAENLRASAVGTIGWVRGDAYSQQKLRLEACEDYREVALLKQSGATQTPDNTGTRVYRQLVTMQNVGGAWKASDFETAEQLQDCQI